MLEDLETHLAMVGVPLGRADRIALFGLVGWSALVLLIALYQSTALHCGTQVPPLPTLPSRPPDSVGAGVSLCTFPTSQAVAAMAIGLFVAWGIGVALGAVAWIFWKRLAR